VTERVESVRNQSLQTGGEDPAEDGVASGIYHRLVLIMAEMLDRIALTGVAIKGWNRELLGKFTFQYAPGKGGVGCIGDDGSESVVVWHFCFLDLLLYRLVEILDAEELLCFLGE